MHTRTDDLPSPHRDERAVDRGFSAVEITIAIVLMATVVFSLMNAVFTGIKASSTSRSSARVETAIVNAADRVNRAPKSCDYTIYAQLAVLSEEWPQENAVVTHEYYVPGADSTAEGTWAVGPAGKSACPDGVATDLLVQRVTITISSPEGGSRRTIQVVKSDV